ncbi:ABC1-related protein, putative [Theileria annulata]|uniref:ABC1-related protein, putative n=1 Tax=Theileria annulata TaxID=5874 RepID=Q4UE53_THEAN|nr:ABC1-related protein, putative [Theileria annulata]CAI74636.1 ABC1-related protein, putative [Theileria annulata]|eukprot:XP_952368.1 ABC1-related protein, putative [Theileria annulata]
MEAIKSARNKDKQEQKYTSVQRSMDIFIRLTNLSMEWNMCCFVGTFVSNSDREEYWDNMHKKMAQSILDNIKTLKGCWVKLGQFLSTKTGFLPRYYLEAFSQLQDYMPNSDFSEIIDTIEEDLGYMDDIYSSFDSIPIASASIAQVHKGRLVDGSQVAVKVQHKSSEQNLMNDIEILKMITSLMNAAGVFHYIRDYFEEYASYAAKELDFVVETANIQYSHLDVYRSKVPVKVPKLYSDYCSRHVITMEFYDLYKFTDKEFIEKYNVNMMQMIYDLHDFAFFQIMSCGRFHSDPHPGNLQLTYDQKDKRTYPVFLDWGFTTNVGEVERLGLCKLYISVYTFDFLGLTSALLESGFTLLNMYPFRYDLLFNSLISILLSSHRTTFGAKKPIDNAQASKEAQARLHMLIKEFLTNYFDKAPNFLPLTFKVLSEYHSLSRTVATFAPFLHLIYKNASFAMYSVYDSPLNYYYGSLGLPLLQNKLNSIKYKLLKMGVHCTFYDLLEKLSTDSLNRNKNFRIFSELILTNSKNLLESRLSDLLRHLYQDNDNLVSFQISVIHNGSIDVELSFGDIWKYEKRPVSNECLFPLFSITSGILSIAVLHLSSLGMIDLDDRVYNYWPEFKNKKEYITIRDIMDQKCGVIYMEYPFIDLFTSRENIAACIENAEFLNHDESSADYMFAIYGFILSEIITRVTRVPTEQFVLMLTSMVGIDNKNFLFPNMDEGKEEESESESNEDEEQSNEETPNPAINFTKNLNVLFEQSVSVFWKNLPTFHLFNNEQMKSREQSDSTSSDEEDEDKRREVLESPQYKRVKPIREEEDSKFRYSDSSDVEDKQNSTREKKEDSNYVDLNINSPKSGSSYCDTSDSSSSDYRNRNVKLVSLDDNRLDSNLKTLNISIDEYRRNLSFESTVIDIPRDEKGEIDSTYYCYCYKYDKDFPDHEFKRCYVPTKYCPMDNRLVKLLRTSSIDSLYPFYSKMMTPQQEELADSDYCSVILTESPTESDSEDISEQIEKSFRKTFDRLSSIKYDYDDTNYRDINFSGIRKSENTHDDPNINNELESLAKNDPLSSNVIGKMGRMVRNRNKVCFSDKIPENPRGFTYPDFIRFNCPLINPVNSNYPKFYRKSVPFLNARSNSLSLCLFYYSILSGSLISTELLDEVMEHNYDDNSLIGRSLSGLFKPTFSLGFQKFTFLDVNNNFYQGFGHSDVSGSVVFGIPVLNLCICIFVSHCSRHHVLIKVLQFILAHYGLRLLGYKIPGHDLYKVLSLL